MSITFVILLYFSGLLWYNTYIKFFKEREKHYESKNIRPYSREVPRSTAEIFQHIRDRKKSL